MRWPVVPLMALVVLAAACDLPGEEQQSTPNAIDQELLEPPGSPPETAERFLELWKRNLYGRMYEIVSTDDQADISKQDFVDRYKAVTSEATITGIDYELGPNVVDEDTEIPTTVTFHTTFFGDIEQSNTIPIVREKVTEQTAPGEEPEARQEWRVDWSPSLVFSELDDRSFVHLLIDVPRRGSILDRKGRELAVDAEVLVIGVQPDLITDKQAVVSRLASALGMSESEVRAKIEVDLPSYYFVPVMQLPYGTKESDLGAFYDMVDLGVLVQKNTRRLYLQSDTAAHVIGFLAEVSAEELEELEPKGYRPGDKIGAFGIEGQMDDVLAGERGGSLVTITPEGTISRVIAEKEAVPGKDITLTIDLDVQKKAEETLGDRVGSIVVIDPRDNSVLALVSYPRFEPQALTDGLSAQQYNQMANDPREPFLHRPLLATYPPGSTFKPVTMAAGVEEGVTSTGEGLPCPPVWTGLGEEFPKNNWQAVDRGYLTPAEGLMASCNPVFYEIALRLDQQIGPGALPKYAAGFGYGHPTGIDALDEAPGVLPGPEWKEQNWGEPWYSGDTVNMGIGQGFLLVTPLQLANAYSAIAGSGVLRQPLLVKSIAEPGGAAAKEFEAEKINPLPVSDGTLAEIRHGLTLVTQNPGGTSYQVFSPSPLDVAGKSGTAEDIAFGADHVFFVAYANRLSPSAVTLVALEEGRLGSIEAGPKARTVLEATLALQG